MKTEPLCQIFFCTLDWRKKWTFVVDCSIFIRHSVLRALFLENPKPWKYLGYHQVLGNWPPEVHDKINGTHASDCRRGKMSRLFRFLRRASCKARLLVITSVSDLCQVSLFLLVCHPFSCLLAIICLR